MRITKNRVQELFDDLHSVVSVHERKDMIARELTERGWDLVKLIRRLEEINVGNDAKNWQAMALLYLERAYALRWIANRLWGLLRRDRISDNSIVNHMRLEAAFQYEMGEYAEVHEALLLGSSSVAVELPWVCWLCQGFDPAQLQWWAIKQAAQRVIDDGYQLEVVNQSLVARCGISVYQLADAEDPDREPSEAELAAIERELERG